jgi:hypothetical protein
MKKRQNPYQASAGKKKMSTKIFFEENKSHCQGLRWGMQMVV